MYDADVPAWAIPGALDRWGPDRASGGTWWRFQVQTWTTLHGRFPPSLSHPCQGPPTVGHTVDPGLGRPSAALHAVPVPSTVGRDWYLRVAIHQNVPCSPRGQSDQTKAASKPWENAADSCQNTAFEFPRISTPGRTSIRSAVFTWWQRQTPGTTGHRSQYTITVWIQAKNGM